MKCTRKHCTYQVPDELFICPKCGLGPEEGGLTLESVLEDECDKMHDDDFVVCYNHNCDYSVYAKSFSKRVAREQHLVVCPMCRGKGMIKENPRKKG